MPIVSLHIPQIGEGLQEARLVAVLKQPGDRVRRDEPIYQMETDKAVMDVESPFEGVLVEWVAPVDSILAIGAEVGRIDTEVGATGDAGPSFDLGVSEPAPAAAAATASPAGNLVTLQIPQIGEGLQEARLVAILKQPGDTVKRDEPIYQMETDKAVMDVESSYAGVIESWLAPVDSVLSIGADVVTMRISDGQAVTAPSSHGPAAEPTPAATASVIAASAPVASGERRRDVPPRTRAYAKEKGISNEALESIPAQGSKLMPEDIDAFLAGGAKTVPATVDVPAATGEPKRNIGGVYSEVPLPQKQRILNSRMQRGSALVVPGTIMVATRWSEIESIRAEMKASGSEFQPSSFTMFSYAIAQTLKDFPGFRSAMVGDETLRTYQNVSLGIAVSLPGDELVLAVVEEADTLSWPEFAARMRTRIEEARGGKDQANEAVTISLTNMQSFGLRDAVPVVVPPSVATLFLGEVYKGIDQTSDEMRLVNYANLALTFDHRVINGVGASQFIQAVKTNVEGIRGILG